MQVGFYFNQTRCMGCHACQVACKDWNDIPSGAEKWMSIKYNEKGKCPDVFVSYLINPCFHCLDPVCVPVCPVGAITKKQENGIVIVDSDKCLGNEECNYKCLKACPYKAPQFGPEKGSKVRKCNFCVERFVEGKLPVCVEACRTRAIDAGSLDDLTLKYGNINEADNFKYSERIKPAIIFKPKLRK